MNDKVKEIMDKENCSYRTAYRRIANVNVGVKKSDSDEGKDGYSYSKGQWV